MGKYDLPAFISHILTINTTKNKLIYIGHSQGTTAMFSALCQRNIYYNKRVSLVIMMAPVARVSKVSSICKLAMKLKIDKIAEKIGVYEVLSDNEDLNRFNSWIMPNFPLISSLISSIISDINSHQNNNTERLPVYFSHVPCGTSLKSFIHYI